MKPRPIRNNIMWMGAIDWNRRLFDSLIPIPNGTSYNAYLVKGSKKTALLDTVDPAMKNTLLDQMQSVLSLDYLISHHAEQDHSGTIPTILDRYPECKLICSPKAKGMLIDHLEVSPERIQTVDDGGTVSLGDKTLTFLHTPWVHWPETMSTYIPEDKILFSCDLFGSHLATSELYANESHIILEAAKLYYAEIMMPFRKQIQNHLKKFQDLEIDLIAPSHGPVYNQPEFILKAYKDWTSERLHNLVVIAYISMHGSTEAMVDCLLDQLTEHNIPVHKFNLAMTDIGKLATSLVDAATLVLATPTVHAGPHPTILFSAALTNALRPKLKYGAIIGSYGWGSKVSDQIKALMPALKVEMLDTILCKGVPKGNDIASIVSLADKIKEKHSDL